MKLYLSSTAAVTDWDGLKSVLSGVRGTTLLTAVLLLVVGIVTVRIAMRLIRRAMLKSRLERGPVRFILSAIRFVLYFLVLVIVASYVGIDMSSFVALLSVVSLAVSLSVQSVLSNVAGGMMLIGSKPFRQGDFVAVDGEEATVDDIGVVYTRMHTVDNRRVLIPNSKLMDATLENYTALGKRRVETEVSASYDCDPQDVFAALQKAIARCEPLEGEERLTEIQSFGDSAITYAVWFWIPAERIIQARFDIRRYIWEEFKAAGIVMTYPHLNVHLDREEA